MSNSVQHTKRFSNYSVVHVHVFFNPLHILYLIWGGQQWIIYHKTRFFLSKDKQIEHIVNILVWKLLWSEKSRKVVKFEGEESNVDMWPFLYGRPATIIRLPDNEYWYQQKKRYWRLWSSLICYKNFSYIWKTIYKGK